MNKLFVIGVGYKPFERRASEALLKADCIVASRRLFEVFSRYGEFEELRSKIMVINNINETIDFVKLRVSDAQAGDVVLLASGDPMFFGIGRRIVSELGAENVEILPDLSSVQCAFSRIRESWDDAFLLSLHGGPDPEKRRRLPYELGDIPSLIDGRVKLAILTDRENNPSAIAKVLELSAISHQLSAIRMFICERLGYPDERITRGTPAEIAGMTFGEPNVVIIRKVDGHNPGMQEVRTNEICDPDDDNFSADRMRPSANFGLAEGDIAHSRGLITKDEVRAVSIHKLQLPARGVLWDIGAGSGSVSIEAARISPHSIVYAVEKDEEQLANIEINKKRFIVPNVKVVAGEAPGALKDLPSPDRVFVGGSGGRLPEIMHFIWEKTSADIVVINAVTIEALNEASSVLRKKGFSTDVAQVSVTRSKVVNGRSHMNALNPIFVIRGERR